MIGLANRRRRKVAGLRVDHPPVPRRKSPLGSPSAKADSMRHQRADGLVSWIESVILERLLRVVAQRDRRDATVTIAPSHHQGARKTDIDTVTVMTDPRIVIRTSLDTPILDLVIKVDMVDITDDRVAYIAILVITVCLNFEVPLEVSGLSATS